MSANLRFSPVVRRLLILCLMLAFVHTAFAGHRVTQYKVLPGESLGIIALKLYGNVMLWKKLARENRVSPPYTLFGGQKLSLSKPPTQTIAHGSEAVVSYWREMLSKRKGAIQSEPRQIASSPEVEAPPAPPVSPTEPAQSTPPLSEPVRAAKVASRPEKVLFTPRKLLSIGVSYFSDSLTQTGINNLTFSGLEVGGSAKMYLGSSNFFLRGAVSYGVINFSTSLANFNVGVLDGNVGLGHTFLNESGPFSISPYLSGKYSTMFVTAAAFGYQNVFEFGAGLEMSIKFCQHLKLLGSVDYHFANQFFSTANREIDVRAGLQYRFDGTDALVLTGSYFHLLLNDTTAGTTASLGSYQAGINYVRLIP